MPRPTPWTEREVEILLKLVDKGCTSREMAKVLKSRSMAAIYLKCQRIGVDMPGNDPDIDFDLFKQMVKTVRNPKCV